MNIYRARSSAFLAVPFIVLLILLPPGSAIGQSRGLSAETGTTVLETSQLPDEEATGESGDAAGDPPEKSIEPPNGFNELILGLELEEIKQRLQADSNFAFRGDPDVSMLSAPNETLIETTGTTFIERAYFQFTESRLYSIILELDQTRLDHYTMYTQLVGSYGEPDSLDPSEAVWDFESVRLSLERPLSVKYLDSEAFERIIGAKRKAESLNKINRDRFLDQF